jgi:hypothetical protein
VKVEVVTLLVILRSLSFDQINICHCYFNERLLLVFSVHGKHIFAAILFLFEYKHLCKGPQVISAS